MGVCLYNALGIRSVDCRLVDFNPHEEPVLILYDTARYLHPSRRPSPLLSLFTLISIFVK